MKIRAPQFADNQWYPSGKDALQEAVQGYLAGGAERSAPGRVLGLVAPHAGYFFSGPVAGVSFAAARDAAVETVVLLGPDHRGAALGQVSTSQAEAWATPLGQIQVSQSLLEAIEERLPITRLAFDQEHSLEVELPFLQQALGEFTLVPLMMGDQSLRACRELAEALSAVLPGLPGLLLVASSDLSHYFDDDTARRLDRETLAYVRAMDAEGLIRHIEQGRRQGQPLACGGGPIAVVMRVALALGANRATLLKYATSGDVWGDKRRVVGYSAVAFSSAG
ncbi:MAG: AmmeMemoRadiSam system protein B [Anaerolineae bacterium]